MINILFESSQHALAIGRGRGWGPWFLRDCVTYACTPCVIRTLHMASSITSIGSLVPSLGTRLEYRVKAMSLSVKCSRMIMNRV